MYEKSNVLGIAALSCFGANKIQAQDLTLYKEFEPIGSENLRSLTLSDINEDGWLDFAGLKMNSDSSYTIQVFENFDQEYDSNSFFVSREIDLEGDLLIGKFRLDYYYYYILDSMFEPLLLVSNDSVIDVIQYIKYYYSGHGNVDQRGRLNHWLNGEKVDAQQNLAKTNFNLDKWNENSLLIDGDNDGLLEVLTQNHIKDGECFYYYLGFDCFDNHRGEKVLYDRIYSGAFTGAKGMNDFQLPRVVNLFVDYNVLDIDGDGNKDLLLTAEENNYVFYDVFNLPKPFVFKKDTLTGVLRDGNVRLSQFKTEFEFPAIIGDRYFFDFDNDGDDDLFVVSKNRRKFEMILHYLDYFNRDSIDYKISIYQNNIETILGNKSVDNVVGNVALVDDYLSVNGYKNGDILIYDANGRKVKEIKITEESQYDMSFLISGIYIAKVVAHEGIFDHKLVKF